MKYYEIWWGFRFSVGRNRNPQHVRKDKKPRVRPISGSFLFRIATCIYRPPCRHRPPPKWGCQTGSCSILERVLSQFEGSRQRSGCPAYWSLLKSIQGMHSGMFLLSELRWDPVQARIGTLHGTLQGQKPRAGPIWGSFLFRIRCIYRPTRIISSMGTEFHPAKFGRALATQVDGPLRNLPGNVEARSETS